MTQYESKWLFETSCKSRQSCDFQPYISQDTSTVEISRYEEKSEMVSLYDGNFEFPAKQDIFLKIKELCHIDHKTREQMPFTFL